LSIHNAAEQWIYSKLSGDSTLNAAVGGRIFAHIAPATATYPLVLFAALGARDVRTLGPARIMTHLTYKVVAINEGGGFGAPLGTIADRIDAVLQAASGTVAAGTVMACVREQPFEMVEVGGGGRIFRHLGGVYELVAR
jgi:hypothetical protein